MARDYFTHVKGGPLVGGTVITDVQASLNATSAFSIDADGIFGRQTEDALRGFQTARGLPATGTVSDTTWPVLMRSDEPPIFERCLQVLASFEGTGFTLIEGNFDGAGLTWGIVGFTLRDGELGQVLGEVNARLPDVMSAAFGADAATILRVAGPGTSAAERIAFADSITGPRFRVAEPWRTFFDTLGRNREVQRLQVERARRVYWQGIAVPEAAALDAREELDLLLLFDIAVQNGGLRSRGLLDDARRETADVAEAAERRRVLARIITDDIHSQFQDDVRARKTCIADGTGVVHGGSYALASWGFLDGLVPRLPP